MKASDFDDFYDEFLPNVQKFVESDKLPSVLQFMRTTTNDTDIEIATNILFYICDSDFKHELLKHDLIADLIIILKIHNHVPIISGNCIYLLTEYFMMDEKYGKKFVQWGGLEIVTQIFKNDACFHFRIIYMIDVLRKQGLKMQELFVCGFMDCCYKILVFHEKDSVIHEMVHYLFEKFVDELGENAHSLYVLTYVFTTYKNFNYPYMENMLDKMFGNMLKSYNFCLNMLRSGFLTYCVDFIDADSKAFRPLNYILSYFLDCYLVVEIFGNKDKILLLHLLLKLFRKNIQIESDIQLLVPTEIYKMLLDGFCYHTIYSCGFVDDCMKSLTKYNRDSVHYDMRIKVIDFCFSESVNRLSAM